MSTVSPHWHYHSHTSHSYRDLCRKCENISSIWNNALRRHRYSQVLIQININRNKTGVTTLNEMAENIMIHLEQWQDWPTLSLCLSRLTNWRKSRTLLSVGTIKNIKNRYFWFVTKLNWSNQIISLVFPPIGSLIWERKN